ncbi:PAS domain S-box protein [Bosea sp. (in: a-proteobacteria)]|uniref:PAS domain S-box protein n=1 Tax=Bosea sp. (in: a-proteobacteria) TaxID=1871050 RepID=UPI000A77F7E0|nr:PAS domain S-box protein [Bosea sp. (in: a-proteobacteria)]
MEKRFLHRILAGLSDGVILIDADGTIAWANEAALSVHGVDNPADLGRDADDYAQRFALRYLNRHPLEPRQYPMKRVLAGEEIDDIVVEVAAAGHPDISWFHQVRSISALDDGRSETCAIVIHDATARFRAEERFEAAFSANPAPAVICRLADRCYIKVNQGFLEMTGYPREAVIGRTLAEIDVLSEAQRRDHAMMRLDEGASIPQMEAVLRLPDGHAKAVIVAGQPIEIGEEACMLFTFADLEPRTRVETALRQSEERFQKAFELSPAPQILLALGDLRLIGANLAFATTFGWSEAEAIGRTFADLSIWSRASDRRRFVAAVKAGPVREFECCLLPRRGGEIDCLIAAEPAVINEQPHMLCVIQDISGQKRGEREIAAAIDAAMADTSWLTRTIMQKLAAIQKRSGPKPGSPAPVEMPSERERQVLALICQGLDDGEIGARLSLARNTVRNHISALYRRIGVHSRSEAILWAHEAGLGGTRSGGTEAPGDGETKPVG